jgi:Flp pilus assembly protein TadG
MANEATGCGDKARLTTARTGRALWLLSLLARCYPSKNTARAIWNIVPERHGNVALLTALLLPAFLGVAGLGVEASNWSVLGIELQRGVDAASQAAALIYNSSGDAQIAANAGADLMELNGLASGSRTWNSGTNTLTEGLVTIRKVAGIRKASDAAFSVSVYKSVPLAFAKLFVSGSSMPVSARSWSELIVVNSAQPCIVAFATAASAISVSGNGNVNAPNCSIRSDGGVSVSGNGKVVAEEVDAATNITGGSAITGTKHANYGTIPDPYASDSTVQNDIAALHSGSGSALSFSNGTQTVSPGTYSSLSISGNGTTVTMQPGLYTINGNISIAGAATLNAAGVTIVSSGTLAVTGQANVTWSAPGTSPVNNAVPGMAFVSNSTGAMNLAGQGTVLITGVFYAPKAAITMAGNASSANNSCFQVLGNTVSFSGNATLAEGCAAIGALSFGSTTATTVALVQ